MDVEEAPLGLSLGILSLSWRRAPRLNRTVWHGSYTAGRDESEVGKSRSRGVEESRRTPRIILHP